MRNLQVTDPTTSTLNVRWEPAEGNVREYIVIWVPVAGGEQDVVRLRLRHDFLLRKETVNGRTVSRTLPVLCYCQDLPVPDVGVLPGASSMLH